MFHNHSQITEELTFQYSLVQMSSTVLSAGGTGNSVHLFKIPTTIAYLCEMCGQSQGVGLGMRVYWRVQVVVKAN